MVSRIRLGRARIGQLGTSLRSVTLVARAITLCLGGPRPASRPGWL
jgi:hypothetical protein